MGKTRPRAEMNSTGEIKERTIGDTNIKVETMKEVLVRNENIGVADDSFDECLNHRFQGCQVTEFG